jgi:hypothetical protein
MTIQVSKRQWQEAIGGKAAICELQQSWLNGHGPCNLRTASWSILDLRPKSRAGRFYSVNGPCCVCTILVSCSRARNQIECPASGKSLPLFILTVFGHHFGSLLATCQVNPDIFPVCVSYWYSRCWLLKLPFLSRLLGTHMTLGMGSRMVSSEYFISRRCGVK